MPSLSAASTVTEIDWSSRTTFWMGLVGWLDVAILMGTIHLKSPSVGRGKNCITYKINNSHYFNTITHKLPQASLWVHPDVFSSLSITMEQIPHNEATIVMLWILMFRHEKEYSRLIAFSVGQFKFCDFSLLFTGAFFLKYFKIFLKTEKRDR